MRRDEASWIIVIALDFDEQQDAFDAHGTLARRCKARPRQKMRDDADHALAWQCIITWSEDRTSPVRALNVECLVLRNYPIFGDRADVKSTQGYRLSPLTSRFTRLKFVNLTYYMTWRAANDHPEVGGNDWRDDEKAGATIIACEAQWEFKQHWDNDALGREWWSIATWTERAGVWSQVWSLYDNMYMATSIIEMYLIRPLSEPQPRHCEGQYCIWMAGGDYRQVSRLHCHRSQSLPDRTVILL